MQGEADDVQIGRVLDAIRRIVQSLRRSSRQAEVDHGLSGAQLFVLRKLAASDRPLSLSELAERTLTHPSSISVVVARLVERGFVLRAPSATDGRRSEVRLAAKGRTFLKRAAPVTAQERLAGAIAELPRERRALLAELLTAVLAEAGFADEDASMFFEEGGKEDGA